ncbi:hypothetical protein RJ639_028006 [Escallonia herrerae]|uniref:Expansin-like EG45 domain-containing protein n=1 Tax=Escallonia herrerae TaxID=1293975 RepID=A0AA88X691_9ASTE|nr:hypothetical protein RJ639_028006 [Escallonia herrerae]
MTDEEKHGGGSHRFSHKSNRVFYTFLVLIAIYDLWVSMMEDGGCCGQCGLQRKENKSRYFQLRATSRHSPSSCDGFTNEGVMIAAASDAVWDNRGACGRHYRVKCTGATNQGDPHPCSGNSVVVKIVDYCPPGCRGTIDLSQEAFAAIANPDAGKIEIEFESL